MNALGIELPRVHVERERKGLLVRMFAPGYGGEIAYLSLALQGLCAEIEFPSDWHEYRRGWIRVGIGVLRIGGSFPWPWVVPDHYQCSGPKFGFCFFDDGLHLSWGKSKGKRDDPFTIVGMPWRWKHREHQVLGEPESHPYRYVLRSGEVQERIATIKPERRLWTRWWLPFRRESRYIDVNFSDEVGERTGSWKGGVMGCSYEMQPGDAPLDALRRMEAERRFA